MKPLERILWTALALLVIVQAFGVTPAIGGGDAPIGGGGFKVLVVYESSEVTSLPKEQAAIFTGTEWQAAVKDAGGEFRVFDQHAEFNEPDGIWEKAMHRPSEFLPRVLVANKGRGETAPLPKDNGAMLALVRKWGAK